MNIIDVNTIYGAGTASTFNYSSSELENYIVSNGIGKALSLNVSGVRYNYMVGNEETINEIGSSQVLMPIASIDPRGFFGEDTIFSDIKNKGFKAIKFFPNLQGWKLNNIVFNEILEINKNYNIPFIINTPDFGDISDMNVKEYNFPIIFSKISHNNCSEFIAIAKKYSNIYVETSSFNAHYVLNKIIDSIGVDRIVFGSDAPKNLAKVSIDFIEKSKLSDTDKEKIFSLNILGIL